MRVPFAAVALAGAAAGLVQGVTPAAAQMRGPANPPPADFSGMQFVDQTGCLFLRAGYGAKTVWVPMVDDQRKPICGMTPTVPGPAPVTAANAPAPPAPPAVPPIAATPKPEKASVSGQMRSIAPDELAASPEPRRVSGYQSLAIGGTTVSCGNAAPVLEKLTLRSGGATLVCTTGNGTLAGWQVPRLGASAHWGAALGFSAPSAANLRGALRAGPVTPASDGLARTGIPAPPKGWKIAWTDGRLNPMRGIGTPQGQAQQDMVWTKTVPARPAAPQPVAPRPVTRVSTMSAPATRNLVVQVGAFGVPANATAASTAIAALGLPAGSTLSSGRGLRIVYAGPFTSRAGAGAALSQLVAAGYRDAFIR